MQTAETLGRKFKTVSGLRPKAAAEDVLALANWPAGREPVLVIGHRPALGQAAAILLCGTKLEMIAARDFRLFRSDELDFGP